MSLIRHFIKFEPKHLAVNKLIKTAVCLTVLIYILVVSEHQRECHILKLLRYNLHNAQNKNNKCVKIFGL